MSVYRTIGPLVSSLHTQAHLFDLFKKKITLSSIRSQIFCLNFSKPKLNNLNNPHAPSLPNEANTLANSFSSLYIM